MTSRAVRRLRDTLSDQRETSERSFFAQAVVRAVGATTVDVQLPGAEHLLTVPRLGSYPPTIGDVVWLAGPPGSWTAFGALAPRGTPTGGGTGGGAPAPHTHAQGDVTGLTADLAAIRDTAATLAGQVDQKADATATSQALDGKVDTSDPRLTDARAWLLHSGAPADGQVPTFDQAAGVYVPATPATTPPTGDGGEGVDSVVRTALFGAATRTEAPALEAQLTTPYTNLAAGDYLISGNMSVVGDDPDQMWSTSFAFHRVILPIAGRYDVEWAPFSSATAGVAAAKVLLNVPNSTTPATAVTTRSVLTAVGHPAGEGTPVAIRRSRRFAAGDTLAFAVYSSVAFGMPVDYFGGIRTALAVRWAGPR